MITANEQGEGATLATGRKQGNTQISEGRTTRITDAGLPVNQRRDPRSGEFSSSSSRMNESNVKHENRQVKARTRRLTVCLFLLAGSISSLTPFLTLHLTNRVGLLLFESDLLQLRSSLVAVIICLTLLVILDLFVLLLSRTRARGGGNRRGGGGGSHLFALDEARSLLLQKLLKQCIGLFALISILAYLSLALIVPHIHQLQRTPFVTFDCNANLITIENCQQQFATTGDQVSLLDSIRQLVLGDLNGNAGRLAERLECLKYNDERLERLRVPTRFLLSKCGLVCEPQRQQLHQFGDDLNSDLGPPARVRPLAAPYSRLDMDEQQQPHFAANDSRRDRDDNQFVSLKLCFSGEINDGASEGTSNYMRFCIENLTRGHKSSRADESDSSSTSYTPFSQHRAREETLTVGQLNAILSHRQPSTFSQENGQPPPARPESAQGAVFAARSDQSTHYVNPIVQFESHFKNWPHLPRASTSFSSANEYSQHTGRHLDKDKSESDSATNPRAPAPSWCKFKPVPPFIVNNKPFSDIHCSLEHDYFMSTRSPVGEARQLRRKRLASTPRIYLQKSSSLNEFAHSERCNIGCQVNVLHQVHRRDVLRPEISSDSQRGGAKSNRLNGRDAHPSQLATSYYLPLKSCLIVQGDKDLASQYYLWFRAVADASLLLSFILVDILLMIESIDTKQFQLEGKKVRLLGILLAITLLPLMVAALFDLSASWIATNGAGNTRGQREGHLMQFINERLIPSMSETFAKLASYLRPSPKQAHRQQHQAHSAPEDLNNSTDEGIGVARQHHQSHQHSVVVDNYLVPFFIYAILMFAFAVNTFKLPLVPTTSPLVRVTSTEELGMVETAAKSTSDGVRNRSGPYLANKAKSLDVLNEPRAEVKTLSARIPSIESKLASLRRSMTSPISSQMRNPDEKSSQVSRSSSPARSVVLFAMLALFMGLQFNLSQITQTQILIETFNIQNDLNQQQQQLQQTQQPHHHHEQRPGRVATSFVLVANSCGTMFVLILALLFSDELSIFMAQLFPFKPVSRLANDLSGRENSVRFKKFLSISLIIYALRYFVLANMSTQMSRMKWLLAILFQSTELLNFPLTWFELASRAHELLLISRQRRSRYVGREVGEQQQQQQHQQQKQQQKGSDCERRAHSNAGEGQSETPNIHILVQSSLAFVYFALARLLALFVHSLHASLYLHSDNVDWFIDTFYDGSGDGGAAVSSAKQGKLASGKKQINVTSSTSSAPLADSLFIPLPSERQTYLHASRSFVKYNSLVCLLVGLCFLLVFCHERYRLWIDQERLAEHDQSSSLERESDLIDERLSSDLRQIHSQQRDRRLRRHRSETTVFTHVPRPVKRHDRQRANIVADSTTDEDGQLRPRARIHFRYDLGLRKSASSSDSSASSSVSSSMGTYYPDRARQPTEVEPSAGRHSTTGAGRKSVARFNSRTIPMILEESRDDDSQGEPTDQRTQTSTEAGAEGEGEEVEEFTRRRVSRMLVKDEEEWSLDEVQAGANGSATARAQVDPALAAACSPPPPGFADESSDENDHDDARAGGLDLAPPAEFDESPLNQLQTNGATRVLPLTIEQQQQHQRRRITFGPTTTFSANSESGDHRSGAPSAVTSTPSTRPTSSSSDSSSRDNRYGRRCQNSRTARRLASPEPSFDAGDDNIAERDHRPGRDNNNHWRETSSPVTLTSPASRLGRHHSDTKDDLDSIDN